MKFYYDLHIHTSLSPCGDRDMTPNNIVNMALLKGLDIIAITDHNSVKNCMPCIEIAESKGLLVIPGMEIQTKEEVHLLCLFKDVYKAVEFEKSINTLIPDIKNKPEFFGEQLIFDIHDNIIGREERLLISSVDITIQQTFKKVKELDGLVIPAHIDKKNFSIISNLGFIPFDLDIKTLEISVHCNKNDLIKEYKYLKRYSFITNSDAHYLGDISERINYMQIENKTIDEVFKFLNRDIF
ncbi:hypothetical protein SAMN02745883_00387 [Caminicella sporogenes DSM 14501]|uniref:Polymerase/histidinol phosphatase N-terminal domain-containing protein n=1 Tax=Caminicella sporogenes DSM 14501 TaxID=1121266 RepID=A0A1M6LXP7_9FIRM|nr:PHP domain-containing protein [Caminicella sporogenes]RKD27989.1 phosphoesterase [Caminicella sporogenes]WIF94408.1 PHP domain-containing protein [Caminicella sporogenes]SHJ75941.1 hypothetical protein SAMN02745883_00387 [Caminicella sporogenes DSM 14501]